MDDRALYSRFESLAQSIARVERKVDFILKELKLEYPDDNVPPELEKVHRLLGQGKKDEAVEEYQKVKNVSASEARAIVEALDIKRLRG